MKMFILKVYAIACSIFFMLFPNFSKMNLAALFEMSPRFAFVLAELQVRRDLSRSKAILGPLERLGESSGFSYRSVGKELKSPRRGRRRKGRPICNVSHKPSGFF